MKKILFLGAFLLQAAFMNAQYNITVNDFTVKAGSTADDAAFLEVVMSYPAEDKIRMAQFNITLPVGITFDQYAFELDDEYFPEYKEGRNMVQPFSVGYNDDTDGSTIVAVTTSKDYFFGKNDGISLRAYILTDANIAEGEYEIKVEKGEFYSPTTGTHKGISSVAKVTIGSTVGINDINAAGKDAPMYNTAGQRVQKAHKGLYIQNGKKVVKK